MIVVMQPGATAQQIDHVKERIEQQHPDFYILVQRCPHCAEERPLITTLQ